MNKRLFRSQVWTTGVFLGFFTLLFGLIYPGIITLVAKGLFPEKAQGSLIFIDNKLKGSFLVGQHFIQNEYFWSRPSDTPVFPYNSSYSSGANLNPANPNFIAKITERVEYFKSANNLHGKKIPVDLVCASGSGLDPHITIAAAQYQVARIAKARTISEEKLRNLIEAQTEKRQLGFLGEERLNVVKLNIALDKMSANHEH